MYNAAESPEGVPSPYHGAVHPYPSYEHGPDYTRPVFDMPFVRQPYNVLSGLGGEGAWLPAVNREGEPTVQPQPNPYYPHWPQVLGAVDNSPGHRAAAGFGMAAVIGASFIGVPMILLQEGFAEQPITVKSVVLPLIVGTLAGMFLSAAPVLVAMPQPER